MLYFNYAKQLPGNISLDCLKLAKPKKSNILFLQIKSASSPKHFGSLKMCSVQALCSIALNRELCRCTTGISKNFMVNVEFDTQQIIP